MKITLSYFISKLKIFRKFSSLVVEKNFAEYRGLSWYLGEKKVKKNNNKKFHNKKKFIQSLRYKLIKVEK